MKEFMIITDSGSRYIVVEQNNQIFITSADGKHGSVQNKRVIMLGNRLSPKEVIGAYSQGRHISAHDFESNLRKGVQIYYDLDKGMNYGNTNNINSVWIRLF